MKTFYHYLVESTKTYKFTIRVAGEVPKEFPKHLEMAMGKYDVVKITTGKRSPIQEKPLDFPQLQNMEVTSFDVEVNYPATSYVLERYLVDTCAIPHSHIVVRSEFDPVDQQQMETTDESKPYEALLNTEDMGGESAQKNAGQSRVMDLLKELETARKEREKEETNG